MELDSISHDWAKQKSYLTHYKPPLWVKLRSRTRIDEQISDKEGFYPNAILLSIGFRNLILKQIDCYLPIFSSYIVSYALKWSRKI
jgi:hypothetical protein